MIRRIVQKQRIPNRLPSTSIPTSASWHRHDAHPQRQDQQTQPPLEPQTPPKQHNAEQRRRQDLELVQNLELHGVQVADGDVLQQVLQRVEGGGEGELPTVAREDGVVDLLEEDGGGRAGGQGVGGFVEGEGEGDGELDELVEEDGRRGEVAVVACRGHDA